MHRRISLTMVIKKRELLFSVIIVCVLLCLGLFISGRISYGAAQTAEKYATATIIEDHSQFRYGMDTNFGNVLLYGELRTDSPVTFDEIGNGYIYIEKVREDYTRHTRTVTKKDSNGRFTIRGTMFPVNILLRIRLCFWMSRFHMAQSLCRFDV